MMIFPNAESIPWINPESAGSPAGRLLTPQIRPKCVTSQIPNPWGGSGGGLRLNLNRRSRTP
jgi:hypothetical protein